MHPPIEIIQPAKTQPGRYRFYREHKYVSFALNDLERLIAKTDFRASSQVEKIEQELSSIVEMLRGHAHYEDSKLHALLREKGSALFQKVQNEHEQHDTIFQTLQNLLEQIKATLDKTLQTELGYHFYLNFRKFVGENLHHLHEEETLILPELQRLYTDAQLRTVEEETYQQMTVDDLVHMMQILFPHFNPSDREAFLSDIRDAAPEKFTYVWESIKAIIAPDEQKILVEKLCI
jgi:hemerythrin-like domain-containing protein